MNVEEKIAMHRHMALFKPVLQQLSLKFRIPWQMLVRRGDEDERLREWFPEEILPYIRNRREQKLYAERAGKILFNLFDDDPEEIDFLVIEAKKKLRKLTVKQ